MMKKLKLATLLLLMVTSVGFIFAQRTNNGEQRERPSAEERAKTATETLVKELKLDEKQSEKLLKINLASTQKTDSLMTNGRRSQEAMTAMRKEMETKDAEIKKLLTETQLKAYEEYQAKLQKERESRQQGSGNGERPQRQQQQ